MFASVYLHHTPVIMEKMLARFFAECPSEFVLPGQIEEYLATGSYHCPTDAERYQIMKVYYQMLVAEGESDAVGRMKQFATYFTHGVRNGSKLRTAVYHARETSEILEMVDRFFADQLSQPAGDIEPDTLSDSSEAVHWDCTVTCA